MALILLKVVAELKASCESLSEEQLAKLGVILFNCEAESMGRQTYLCTEEMVKKTLMMKRSQRCTLILFLWAHLNHSDIKGVHRGHGFRHLERLPHNQQQSACCLLLGSPAAGSTQSRAHSQRSYLHGNKPTRHNEGSQGRFNARSCVDSGVMLLQVKSREGCSNCPVFSSSLLLHAERPAGTEGTDCSLAGQAAGRPQSSANPTGETV